MQLVLHGLSEQLTLSFSKRDCNEGEATAAFATRVSSNCWSEGSARPDRAVSDAWSAARTNVDTPPNRFKRNCAGSEQIRSGVDRAICCRPSSPQISSGLDQRSQLRRPLSDRRSTLRASLVRRCATDSSRFSAWPNRGQHNRSTNRSGATEMIDLRELMIQIRMIARPPRSLRHSAQPNLERLNFEVLHM